MSTNREVQVVQEYADKIDRLVEVEYGDFKRKIGQYLIRLSEALGAHRNTEVRRAIDDLRTHVVFDPNQDIEAAREIVLQKLDGLKNIFS